MNKKKVFAILFTISAIGLFLFYSVIDNMYYSEISKIMDIEKYGYDSSMILYENKIFIVGMILVFSTVLSCLFLYFYNGREKSYQAYIEEVKNKLEALSKGNYEISIDEVSQLGVLYDDLYKLVLELREGKENALGDKLKLKENLEDISHQLKTPLASMEILLELENQNKNQVYFEQMEEELTKINGLISSMLTLARLDVNQIEWKEKEFYMKDAIHASIESLESLIQKNEIEVSLEGENFKVNGDYYWMVEALINVIKNSIEYGKTKVEIATKKTNIYSEVTIKDDGNGFSKEDIQKLFQRFYKSKNSKSGVGIGLNLSKNILEKHNATISAENDNGGKFIIKFYE